MLFWHSIFALKIEWNVLDQSPVVWFIRKTSQLGSAKIPLRFFTIYIDSATAISRDIPYIPVGLIESSFWRFPVDRALMKSKHGNMAQSRSCFWIPLSQLSAGVCQVCLNTKLVENRCFHFKTFDSWITELKIDSVDVNAKDDLWICSIMMVIQSHFIELRVENSLKSQRRWKSKWYWNPSGYSELWS